MATPTIDQISHALAIRRTTKSTIQNFPMIETLKKIGGDTIKEAARLAVRLVLTDQLSQEISWTGRSLRVGNKLEFRATVTGQSIRDTILLANIKEKATQKRVEQAISNFLRRSSDRKRYATTMALKALEQYQLGGNQSSESDKTVLLSQDDEIRKVRHFTLPKESITPPDIALPPKSWFLG
ncbi:uncharacterized protein LOC117175590 [Belonocnema kinseyi]|uniref:uncharacterized protein LOC117175590 n=1 Tax=Belonocnema kinseyi TaxID=2817044 RepID=UPI00143E04E1|nr:uncharacterized protein LOC117175590 [Belonocnema kinseyi]